MLGVQLYTLKLIAYFSRAINSSCNISNAKWKATNVKHAGIRGRKKRAAERKCSLLGFHTYRAPDCTPCYYQIRGRGRWAVKDITKVGVVLQRSAWQATWPTADFFRTLPTRTKVSCHKLGDSLFLPRINNKMGNQGVGAQFSLPAATRWQKWADMWNVFLFVASEF